MLLGHSMGDAYLRFDTQKAVYTFEYISSNDRLTASMRIFRASDDQFIRHVYLDKGKSYDLIMEAGAYYIIINSGNHLEFNVKVTETLIENQIMPTTLAHVATYDTPTEDIPFIEGMLINFEHAPDIVSH